MKKLLLFTFLLCAFTSQAQVIFEDNFEQGSFKPEWTPRPNLTGTEGVVEVVKSTNVASEGQFGVRIGKGSDGDFTTNALDLSLDLSAYNQVEISFDIMDYYEENHEQDGLYFSDNGGETFTKVYDFRAEEWCEVYGAFPPFDVDALAAANGLSLTNQFVIRIQQYDDADFHASGDEDGFYLDNVVVQNSPVRYATLPFTDDFEGQDLKSAWTRVHPEKTTTANTITPNGFATISANAKNTGTYGLAIGKNCDGGFSTSAIDLHLNLSGHSQVEISFDIRDYAEETHEQDGLYFSDNGGETFTKVYDFRAEEWCNDYGSFPPFDIDALAAANGLSLTNQFVIRIQQYDDADFHGSGDEDGFYLDNVVVRDSPIQYATLPFTDDFEEQTLKNAWGWVHPGNTSLPNTTSPTGYMGVTSTAKNTGTYGLQIGKRCDDGFTTNAIDLHVNLAEQSQVELSFDIMDYYDETHEQDGLYFSDNGGESFTKVYDFRAEEWCEVYGAFPPFDVDALAAANGLTLTDRFIIRFQQYDDADFRTSGDEDGFFIDNVVVRNSTKQYASLPFTDDFEEETLNTAWAWVHSDSTGLPNTTKPTGYVAVSPNSRNTGSQGLQIGKRCDDGFTTNAVDLHLNLASQSQVELSFDIRNYYNEPHEQDGIYFSSDGGNSFTKVSEFNFSELPDNAFTTYSISIGEAEQNVSFTNNSIIRIQMYDDADFRTSGDEDGMFIDNLQVVSLEAIEIAAPANFSATVVGTTVQLSWQHDGSNIEGYKVNRSTSEDGEYTTIATLPADQKSYNDEDLPINTLYYYQVIAYTGTVEAPGTIISATTEEEEVTGIEDELPEDTRIYPNPVESGITIAIDNEVFGTYSFRVLNSMGQVLKEVVIDKSQTNLNYQLDISRYNPGIYLLEITNMQYHGIVRIAKE